MLKVVKEYGHEVNDLYALLKDLPKTLHSDSAHYYTKEGAQIISEQVLRCIDNTLGIKSGTVSFDKWFDESNSYEGLAWLHKRSIGIEHDITLGI